MPIDSMESETEVASSSKNISVDEVTGKKTQTLLLEKLDLRPKINRGGTSENIEAKQHDKLNVDKESIQTKKRKGENLDSTIKCRKSNRKHSKIDYVAFDSGIDHELLESVNNDYDLNGKDKIKVKKVGRPCKRNTEEKDSGETSVVETSVEGENMKEKHPAEINQSNSETAVKRKRGRPKKTTATESSVNSSYNGESLEVKTEDIGFEKSFNEIVSPDPVHIKNETESFIETDLINSDIPIQTAVKRKRGRPRKSVINSSQNSESFEHKTQDFSYTDGDDSFTNYSEMNDSSSVNPVNNDSQCDNDADTSTKDTTMITCGVCNLEMEDSKWLYHKNGKHNNLAWKVGEEPIDLNDKTLVTHILNKLYKKKKQLFTCENCGEKKKSVSGFLSHQLVCNKSGKEIDDVKVKCELCERTMLPVSMPTHIKLCHSENKNKTKTSKKKKFAEIAESDTNDLHAGTSKSKRAAAVKANNLLQVIAHTGEIVDNAADSEGTVVLKHLYFTNFDFRSTFYLKRHFEKMLKKDKTAKCLFHECDFHTAHLNEILEHVAVCDFKPKEGFTCRYCILTYKTKDDIEEHIKSTHNKTSNKNDGEYECVEEEPDELDFAKNKMKPAVKIFSGGNLRIYSVKFLNTLSRTVLPVKDTVLYKWTLKFCEEHFNEKDLFQNFRTNLSEWLELDENSILYMPMLDSSVDVAQTTISGYVDSVESDCEWKKYDLLESDVNENASTTFLGGPTQTLAWAPTPFTVEKTEQIIAVAILLDPDKDYYFHTRYNTPGMIQFWNCGSLKNYESSLKAPEFVFSIVHDYGIIWHMEWCPSGCYDTPEISYKDKLKRLGLLAVCCSDSFAYIYSVPQPSQTQAGLYKPKPVLKLQLQTHTINNLGKTFYHATKVSWSKASEHKYVAVGYSNGMVALYNLKSTSELLCLGKDENGIETLLPYKTFQAHYYCITALALFHLNNGCRWLMTGSTDRHSKFWDLENVSSPLTSIRKHVITDGLWLTNWICSIFSYDDASAINNIPVSVHQVRDFLSEVTFVLHACSTVKSITGSDWANGIVEGTSAGEVMGTFPRQLLYKIDSDKSLKLKKKLLSYVNLVEKNCKEKDTSIKKESPADKCLFYNEAAKKYGIVFCDHNLDSYTSFKDKHYDDLGGKVHKLRMLRPDLYPLPSVNNVAFNPNKHSYLYLATGYQAGFLRIRCLKFLDAKK